MVARKNERHGLAFTLIELLVVIAIVALLASMLLPTLSKAKDRALTTQCANQLRQLGVSMQMYGDDSSELLPAAHAIVPWTSTNPVPWLAPLCDYYRNTNILRCAAMSRFYTQSRFNYFMGSHAIYLKTGTHGNVRLRDIRYPTQYLLSGDCNYPFEPDDADPDNYSQDTLFSFVSPVHNHRVNVLFADMHVRPCAKFDPSQMTFALDEPGVAF
jgi:prepilin-type N-terminal cleavage/methylation domain-containing protein/prepilin-type processing-associated H-X9-DG protein